MIELNAIELALDIPAKLAETESAINALSSMVPSIPSEAIELRTIMRRAVAAEERWNQLMGCNLNKQLIDGFPRRQKLEHFTPAEHAIRAAVESVESMAAHPLLTDAVVLLQQAREKVADFVERPR